MTETRAWIPTPGFCRGFRTSRRSSAGSRSWTRPRCRCAWTTGLRFMFSSSPTGTSPVSSPVRTSVPSSRHGRRAPEMATVDELISDADTRMGKSVEHARNEFNTVRTGRASASLLDRIDIDYYGTATPLKQLATIGVPEARMLTVQPFDPGSIRSIEKAIQESDLGLTPSNDGKMIRLPIPQLTEERRKELVKVVRGLAEGHRVAVREIRRDAMKHLKELVDTGEVGADDERRAEDRVQKLTDDHTKQIDDLLKHKEAEVMEG